MGCRDIGYGIWIILNHLKLLLAKMLFLLNQKKESIDSIDIDHDVSKQVEFDVEALLQNSPI